MPAFSALIGLGTALGAGAAGAAGAGAAAGGAAAGATSLAGVAGGLGAAATLAGTGLQAYGMMTQNKAQERAENIRASQMDLEAKRQRRQVVRESLVARGQALSSATAQGASEGSGLAGGLAQIQGQAGSNISDINASQQRGAAMFAANRQASSAGTMASMGSGLSSLGGALFSNQQQIGRLGTYYG